MRQEWPDAHHVARMQFMDIRESLIRNSTSHPTHATCRFWMDYPLIHFSAREIASRATTSPHRPKQTEMSIRVSAGMLYSLLPCIPNPPHPSATPEAQDRDARYGNWIHFEACIKGQAHVQGPGSGSSPNIVRARWKRNESRRRIHNVRSSHSRLTPLSLSGLA